MSRQQINIRLPEDVAEYLETVPSKTDVIVAAVRAWRDAGKDMVATHPDVLKGRLDSIEDKVNNYLAVQLHETMQRLSKLEERIHG